MQQIQIQSPLNYLDKKTKLWHEVKNEPIKGFEVELLPNRDKGRGRENAHIYVIVKAITNKGAVPVSETIYKGAKEVNYVKKLGKNWFLESENQYLNKPLSERIDSRYFISYSDLEPITSRQFHISEEQPRIFQPLQIKLGKGEGIEAETTQVEFAAPQRTKSKVLLTKKEEHEIEKKKATKSKKEYGLGAYGVETEGGSSLRKFFENPIRFLFGNPQLTFDDIKTPEPVKPEVKPKQEVKPVPKPAEAAGQKPRPRKEEYRRPEYQLEQWTAIYAPHLNQWSLNYYVT